MGRLQPGTSLSHYTIREHISTGGMSEVYKAVDDQLGRVVAIKVLSSVLAEDQNARRRFMREAKAASMLSHQSICTIYEVGEENELTFIVMAYIEGQTLKDLITAGALPMDRALAYAIDILDALDEAHQHGIIHRDIKPSNIIINDRDVAVVLDFGLAKQVPSLGVKDDFTLSQVTREAAIIGTTAYLSPEQVGGEPTDARSDIFSFGILFYEMLTGNRPFRGTNDIEIMNAILHGEPQPISEVRPEVALELERIARKTLRKIPEDRYQTVNELKMELIRYVREKGYVVSGIRTVPDRTIVLPAPGVKGVLQRLVSSHLLMVLVLAGLVVGVMVWFLARPSEPLESEPPPDLRVVLLDSWKSEHGETGTTSQAAFSPDGKMIAFSSIKAGAQDIWVKQIDGGDPIPVVSDQGNDWSPVWSPDGQRIAFASDRGGTIGIWTIPMLGGTPQLLTKLEGQRPLLKRWSGDGRRIFYEFGSNLFSLEISSHEIKQITNFDSTQLPPQDFSISPSEDQIAYMDFRGGQYDIWVMAMQGGAPIQVTNDPEQDRHPIWHPDGRRIIYSSLRGGANHVMQVSLGDFKKTQIAVGDSDYSVMDVSSDGTRILYFGSREEADIWKVNVETGEESQVTAGVGVEMWPDVSPDGQAIAFQSTGEAGGGRILSCKIMTKQLATSGRQDQIAEAAFDPRWSPDGRQIAFLRARGGENNIWVVNAAGGDERQLTTGGVVFAGYTILPYNRHVTNDFQWSPDGRAVAYISRKSGRHNIWVASTDSSGERQVTDNQNAAIRYQGPIWSPDGKNIAVTSRSMQSSDGYRSRDVWVIDLEKRSVKNLLRVKSVVRIIGWSRSGDEVIAALAEGRNGDPYAPGEVKLIRIPTSGGPDRMIARIKSAYLGSIQLSPDKRNLALAFRDDESDNTGVVSVGGGKVRRITRNTDPRMYFSGLAWSSDGRVIYFGKQTRSSLVSMIENFK